MLLTVTVTVFVVLVLCGSPNAGKLLSLPLCTMCTGTCCFECLMCMCFVFLYLHLFSAIEHVSHGKAL